MQKLRPQKSYIYIQRTKIPGLRGAFKGDIAMNSETTYDEKNDRGQNHERISNHGKRI